MGYYNIQLSKKKLTYVRPLSLGKYRYKCLPSGIANYLDISRQKITGLLSWIQIFPCVHGQTFDLKKRGPERSCIEVGINAK